MRSIVAFSLALHCWALLAHAKLFKRQGLLLSAAPHLRKRLSSLQVRSQHAPSIFLQARARQARSGSSLGRDSPGVPGCGSDCAGCAQAVKLPGTTPVPPGPPLPIPQAPPAMAPLASLPLLDPDQLPKLGPLPTEIPMPPKRPPPTVQEIRTLHDDDEFKVGVLYQGKDARGAWRLVNLTRSIGDGKFEGDVLSEPETEAKLIPSGSNQAFTVLRHWPMVYGDPEVLKPTIPPSRLFLPGPLPGEWKTANETAAAAFYEEKALEEQLARDMKKCVVMKNESACGEVREPEDSKVWFCSWDPWEESCFYRPAVRHKLLKKKAKEVGTSNLTRAQKCEAFDTKYLCQISYHQEACVWSEEAAEKVLNSSMPCFNEDFFEEQGGSLMDFFSEEEFMDIYGSL
mmetsp:Transcript_75866/g.144259  ORF Transcript_75866/g.144259 Transcript_75866/m.144259 type:complete len:400 (+) Transcript_75866:54-1253(+)